MGKLKQFWIGFGIGLGTIAATIILFLLKDQFKMQANTELLKDKVDRDTEQYKKAVEDRANELAALKADEVVSAFHKAFGGKE